MAWWIPVLILAACVASVSGAGPNPASGREQEYVWWEAEQPETTDFLPLELHLPRLAEVASGGDWLAAREGTFAEYRIRVPRDGEWTVYTRAFWKQVSFRWRFDEQPWRYTLRFGFRGLRLPSGWLATDQDWIDAEDWISDALLLDHAAIDAGYSLNWMVLGKVKLSEGQHCFRIELDRSAGAAGRRPDAAASGMAVRMAAAPRVAAFDAFVLATGGFCPRGRVRPDQSLPEETGWWEFAPQPDTGANLRVDLRTLLNEPYAGSKGFIGTKGESFVHGRTGEAVRFWGVHAPTLEMPPDLLEEQARFFARRGINLVRIFPFHWRNDGARALEVDPVKVRRLQRLVDIYKHQGIYTTIAIYSGRCVYDLEQVPGFEAYANGPDPWLLHVFHPRFLAAYRKWLGALLSAENPFSGIPLAREPAILGIELNNESNVLWWIFQEKNYPPSVWDMVEERYRDWLADRYGSVDAALQAWDLDQAPDSNRLMLAPAYLATQRSRRTLDQIRFVAELERRFNEDTKEFLKDDVGFGGLVLPGNWETVQDVVLGPALAWIESPADFHDHHHYFHAASERKKVDGETILRFRSRSGVRWDTAQPDRKNVCCGFLDVIRDGKPSMVSEYSWLGRNQYRSEYPLFVSAQARGGGTDALVDFQAAPVPGWSGSEVDWTRQNPAVFGQYPAAALLLRTGALKEGVTLAAMRVNEEDALGLRVRQLITKADRSGFNLEAEVRKEPTEGKIIENRGIYLSAGKVRLDVGPFDSINDIADLDPFWDQEQQVIHHSNGQITWDYGVGLYRVDAPCAGAAVGFLSDSGSIVLSSMRLETQMHFGAVCLVSLDGNPLAACRRALLQVMSEQKERGERLSEADNTGWHRLLQTGTSPYMVRDIQGSIDLLWDGADGCRITPLAPNFTACGPSVDGPRLELRKDVIYYLIEN